MRKKALTLDDITGGATLNVALAPTNPHDRIAAMLSAGRASNAVRGSRIAAGFAKRAALRKQANFNPKAVGEFLKNNYGRIGMGILGLLIGAGLGKYFGGKWGAAAGGTWGAMAGAYGGGKLQDTEFANNLEDKYINPAIDKMTDWATPERKWYEV